MSSIPVDTRHLEYPEPYLAVSKALCKDPDEVIAFCRDIQTVDYLTELCPEHMEYGVGKKDDTFVLVFRKKGVSAEEARGLKPKE